MFYDQRSSLPCGFTNFGSDGRVTRYEASTHALTVDPAEQTVVMKVGTSFYCSHTHTTLPIGGYGICVQTFLAVALDTQHTHKNNMFIVRSVRNPPPALCDGQADPTDTLRNCRTFVVALLAGWKPVDSTLGAPLAVSSDSRRIAAAMWDQVLIWTLCPERLCHGPFQAYFPARDYNTRKGIGRLRPVQLPSQGVVHKLHWLDRENLVGVTDRGIAQWYIGPHATGKRVTQTSD